MANFSSICYNISPDTFIDLVGLSSISRHSANCSIKQIIHQVHLKRTQCLMTRIVTMGSMQIESDRMIMDD
jgi:hypothetical protein